MTISAMTVASALCCSGQLLPKCCCYYYCYW